MENLLEVTIWDADGNVVTHQFCEAQNATQDEIDDMVRMIEAGTPAWLAAQIVKPWTWVAEIVGPSGRVHYRRPLGDPLIEEAERTPGYSVRLVEQETSEPPARTPGEG